MDIIILQTASEAILNHFYLELEQIHLDFRVGWEVLEVDVVVLAVLHTGRWHRRDVGVDEHHRVGPQRAMAAIDVFLFVCVHICYGMIR